MKKTLSIFLSIVFILLAVIIIMIAIPPPNSVPKMEALESGSQNRDYSKIPDLQYYQARDGSRQAYREYLLQQGRRPAVLPAAVPQAAVLVHGSTGSSGGMHMLAEYLQKKGAAAYTLDIRGHGGSPQKGDIDYIGQLEDDLEDFVKQVLKNQKSILIGFSAGGGFVLRFAAGRRQKLFSRYILLSPYIAHNSPTVKPGSGGWTGVSYPRVTAILMLGAIGEKLFGHLPVITYAIDPAIARYRTPQYSFRLNRNISPHYNYKTDIMSVKQPLTVIIGEKDEVHNAYAFEPLFRGLNPGIKVIVVPNLGHMALTATLPGISAVAKAVGED